MARWTPQRATVCASLLLIAAALGPGGAVASAQNVDLADDALGTLFYSAAERSAIAQARQGEAGAALLSTRMTVNGLVKRTGGNSTAWVNGQAVVDGHTLRQVGKVSVQRHSVGLDGKSVRVGESLDLSTQGRTDIVAPGAVTVRDKK
ncbi:MAG: hypothetical protein Q8M25_16885 [Rhodoferax sp.]|nr:hypothetical protein [Rhodoferax sp.]